MNGLSQTTNSLLTLLVMDLKNGYIRRCESLGLQQQEMQMLQNITLEDLHYITNSQVSILTFQIHHENLVRMLLQARREKKRMQQIDRALASGGSIELMQHYFGLSSLEVAARRRIAGITAKPGRGVILTEKEHNQLWTLWQQEGLFDIDSAEGLDRIMAMAETMNTSLTAVWHAVKELSHLLKSKNNVPNEVRIADEFTC